MKKKIFLFLTLLLALSFVFFIGEIGLRFGGYKILSFYSLNTFYQEHKLLGWEHVPDFSANFVGADFNGYVEINSQKYRDREYSLARVPGVKRMLVLGDSAVWGWGVNNDEVFTEIIENRLKNYEIINFGRTAYGTDQEMLYFEEEGVEYKPDYVALFFTGSNDLINNSGAPDKTYFVLEEGKLIHKNLSPKSFQNPLKKFLKKHSLLYFFIDYRLQILKQKIKFLKAGKKKRNLPLANPKEPPLKSKSAETTKVELKDIAVVQNTAKKTLTDFENIILDEMNKNWPVTIALLDRLHNDIIKNKGKLIIFCHDCASLNTSFIEEFCRENGIPFVMLEKITVHYYGNKAINMRVRDGHWNKKGHTITADVVLRELIKFGFVDKNDIR